MAQHREQMLCKPLPASGQTASAAEMAVAPMPRKQRTCRGADEQAGKMVTAGGAVPPTTDTSANIAAEDTQTAVSNGPLNGSQRTPSARIANLQIPTNSVPGHSRPIEFVGRYQVGELLGQGSMGSVYAGYDPKLKRPVALKLLHSQPSKSARTRLEREARALARLSHPNVVRVYDAGVYENRVFIAMELVEGQSLKEWCRGQPAPGWRQVLRAYLEAARGIAAAHANGLIHRDIKPANLLIGNDGRVRVADFGFAATHERSTERCDSAGPAVEEASIASASSGLQVELHDRLTKTGGIVGTPAFMAPEQHCGEQVGPAADQYCFCVALYEGLYGSLPFLLTRDQDRIAALLEHKLRGPVKPEPVAAEMPSWLYQVIERGMASVPGDRYPAMEALIAALEPALSKRPRMRRSRTLPLVASSMICAAICVSALTDLPWPNQAGAVCQEARAALVGVWDPARKDRVKTAFLATELAYAPDTFDRVAAVLDSYAAAWVSMRTETCAATRIHATQSAAVMDLRMYCLERRRQKLAALTEQYAVGPDPELLSNAVSAAQDLPAIAYCADIEALNNTMHPPRDPAVRMRVENLYPRVYQLEALFEAGKYRDGFARGQTLLAEMADLDYAPLRVRTELVVAQLLQHATGDYAGAETRLRAAIEMATEANDDMLQAEAWTLLIENLAEVPGRHQEALDLRASMNAAVERADDDLLRARALKNSGRIFVHMGAYEDAWVFYERAAALWERTLGPNHPAMANALTDLGFALHEMGKYQQAIAVQTRARLINETAFGPEHPSLVSALNNLAMVYRALDRYDEARDLYASAVSIAEKALGPEHPTVAGLGTNLGVVLVAIGRYDEAQGHYKRALRIMAKTYGPDDYRVATPLNNLAILLGRMGRYEEATRHHERALAIYERVLGPEHKSVATSLNNLAVMLEKTSRYQEAQRHHERALAIYERTLGPAHTKVAMACNNLAVVLAKMSRYEEAQRHHERALAIYKRTLGSEHTDVAKSLNNLANVEEKLGHYDAAKNKLERAVAIFERSLGGEHARVAIALNNLANVLYKMGAHEQAQAHLERAVAIGEAALGPTHPKLADMLSRLGGTVLRRGQLAAAERYLARAEEILEASPPRPASVAMMLLGYGKLALARSQPEQAVARLERALELEPLPAAYRSELQYALARALWTTGAHRKRALTLAREVRDSYQQIGNQPMGANVRRWLAMHQPRLRREN